MSKTIREELKDMYKAKGGQQADLTNDSQTIAGMIKAINRNEAASQVLSPLSIEAAASDLDLWGTPVSAIQDEIAVDGQFVTGKLYEQKSGQIVTDWGPGYFIAIKLTSIDAQATSVLTGLEPSKGTGLVEIINDPDKVAMCKIDSKDTQIFKVIQSDGTVSKAQGWSLSGLTLVPADE